MTHSNCEVAPITVARVIAYPLRVRVKQGPESSLGPMPVRQGCLLRLEDSDGAYGWGEIWCNFPPHAAESRAFLVQDVIAPYLQGQTFQDWRQLRAVLEEKMLRMMIHTGESGVFSQCFAGIDMAVADLCARRANVSMVQFLGGSGIDSVSTYASTPSSGNLESQCNEIKNAGHSAIKLKIGYEPIRDIAAIGAAREVLGSEFSIMVDANQAWSYSQAKAQISALEPFQIDFIEEPILASEDLSVWKRLSEFSPIALAAGENISSQSRFEDHINDHSLHIVQPDVAKWGGISGAVSIARYANAHDVQCYLHFMGTGLGLAASLHVLSVIGGDGRVELDVNENPLRTELGEINLTVSNGNLSVPCGAGFGFEPDPAELKRFSI